MVLNKYGIHAEMLFSLLSAEESLLLLSCYSFFHFRLYLSHQTVCNEWCLFFSFPIFIVIEYGKHIFFLSFLSHLKITAKLLLHELIIIVFN